MKLFTDLYVRLDQTNKTNEKVEAMREYFAVAPPADAAWALYFLSGRKPRQIVPSKFLRSWSLELSGVPEWLYQESRDTVGDGAETMALLLPNTDAVDETPLAILVEQQLLPLRGSDEVTQKSSVTDAWSRMNYSQRLVYNKLITGAFRVGVSQLLVMRALSQLSEIAPDVVALRLMGEWAPTAQFSQSSSIQTLIKTQLLSPGPTPSVSRINSISRLKILARFPIGRRSGSGTAFAHR